MSIRIKDFCTYAPKSDIKAGEASPDGQYMFFTSSEDENKRYTDYQFDGEGIIMGTGGNATLHYYNGKYAVSTDCIVLTPDTRVRCKYLYYFFLANMHVLEAGFKGAGLKHTNKKYIGNIELASLPTLQEQDSVIEILDKVSEVIRARGLELSSLDDLIKARFVEMFGNEMNDGIPLKDCCIDVRGGGTPSMQHPEYYGGDVPFIKSGDVRGDTVSSGALWLTEQALSETTAKYVPKGSVLVVNRSASLLREFRAAIAIQPVVINQDIKAFIPRKEFTSEYLLWAIKIQTQLLLTKVTTVLTSHIDLKDLLDLRIVPASIERQKDFSIFINQVDKSKVAVQKALDKAQVLFDSLMQQYFG